MIKMSMPGLKVLENKLNRAIQRVSEIPVLVFKEATKVDNYARTNVPKGKTKLLSSSHDSKIEISNGKTDAYIKFTAHYAAYQDFGIGTMFPQNPNISSFRPYMPYIRSWKKTKKVKGFLGKNYLFHPYILSSRVINRAVKLTHKNLMK